MRKLLHFLPFHFAIFLIIGIYTQLFFEIWQYNFTILLAFHLVYLLILVLISHQKIRTFLAFGYFFFAGITAVFINDDANYSSYFMRFSNEHSTAILKVDKVLKSSNFHDKYYAKVVHINTKKTRGIVLLNVENDNFSKILKVDELIAVKANVDQINPSLNPHQFNYKKYLENQGIRQQIFVKKSHFLRLGFGQRTLNGWAAEFRDFVQSSMKKYAFQKDELAVINALLLGERRDVSKELLTDYANSGAIHILAVSGLHVGIILFLLLHIFGFLSNFKNGKTLQTLIVILILWIFAFIAGLSASVVRAVTMFSFLALGQLFGSKKTLLFSLFSSLFILLIIKPLFLFDVGFQLSYLAVLGIIAMQQKIYQLISFKSTFIDFFWQIIAVSLAAQIGVLPLSLFYFHQFPGLFFLSNMIIIPCLGVILMAGIVVILLSMLKILPQFLADLYGFIISLMNSFVNWISNQEAFLFKDISFSFSLLVVSYVVIFFGVQLLHHQTAKKGMFFLGSIVVLQSVILVENYQNKKSKEFIVFHKTKYTVLGFRVQNKIQFMHTIDSIKRINSIVTGYKIGENVDASFKKMNSNSYQFQNQPILIVDSLGVYQLENLKNPIVILQNSPKINFERMILKINPKIIIVDGTNYKKYAIECKKISKKRKVPFHNTFEKGAYILKN